MWIKLAKRANTPAMSALCAQNNVLTHLCWMCSDENVRVETVHPHSYKKIQATESCLLCHWILIIYTFM